jgi:hypothetical protein
MAPERLRPWRTYSEARDSLSGHAISHGAKTRKTISLDSGQFRKRRRSATKLKYGSGLNANNLQAALPV